MLLVHYSLIIIPVGLVSAFLIEAITDRSRAPHCLLGSLFCVGFLALLKMVLYV